MLVTVLERIARAMERWLNLANGQYFKTSEGLIFYESTSLALGG